MKWYLIVLMILIIVFSLIFILKREYFIINLGLQKIIDNEVTIDRILKTSLEPVQSALYNNQSVQLPSFFFYKPTLLNVNEDQGVCGSCWAFASCNVLSDRATIFTNGVFRKRLSVQQIISCIKDGCNGGNPENVFKWGLSNKIYTENNFGYLQEQINDIKTNCSSFIDGQKESFNVLQDSIKSLTQFIPNGKSDDKTLQNNINNMKLELYLNGPFYATIDIYQDFINFSGDGVYQYDKKGVSQGGHAIEVIGYCNNDVDKRYNLGYWICRNSWSKDWPRQTNDKGYFAIIMGRNECGIESRCCKADLAIITEERPNRSTFAYSNIDEFYKDIPQDCSFNTNKEL